MKRFLFIINASPYGEERFLSAVRLALMLTDPEQEPVALQVFLMSDAEIGRAHV